MTLIVQQNELSMPHKSCINIGPGVRLLWRGVEYPNNSIVRIKEIGEGVDAVACQTDMRPCCGTPYRIGEWYYPNGSRVPIEGAREPFYRNRNDEGLVMLHRRYYSLYPTGLYCCVLPDATQQKVMGHTYPKYWVKTTATQTTHAVGNSYQLGML